MTKAEELAAARGITQAQAFEKLLGDREPGLRTTGEMRSGAVMGRPQPWRGERWICGVVVVRNHTGRVLPVQRLSEDCEILATIAPPSSGHAQTLV